MEQQSSVVIIQLPNDVLLLSVLTEWLAVQDICHLDTAVCNKSQRPSILCLFETKYRSSKGHIIPNVIYPYLNWLCLRGLHVRQLAMQGSYHSIKREGINVEDHIKYGGC